MNPRFFVDAALAVDTTIALPPAVAHHAARVLRLAAGDAVTLFDGSGGEYSATIARAGRDAVTVSIAAFDPIDREPARAVTLAQAIVAADAMDWAVRKAVELGVAEIVPLIAARTNVAGGSLDRRLAHWRQIAIAACEQCGRNRVPPIAEAAPLERWLERDARAAVIVAPGATRSLAALARERDVAGVVVGPEGGFSERELAAADRFGVVRAHLGPRILRAETAAAAALATIAAVAGDAS